MDQNVDLRINKTQGNIMKMVGVMFDLAPILVFIFVFIGVFMALSGDGAFVTAEQNQSHCEKADSATDFRNARELRNVCDEGKIIRTGQVVFALATGGAASIVVGSAVYVIGSVVVTFFAYILFSFWFLLYKVNIWSVSSGKRILMSGLTFLIENIPLANIFFPGIFFMVWGHIKISNIEDIAKSKLHNKVKRP